MKHSNHIKTFMPGDEDQTFVQVGKSSTTLKMSEPWENSNHPLFIHHSDQPGAVLVSQPLVEDNYTTWAQSMTMALTIKNKKGFVDEKDALCEIPPCSVESSTKIKAYVDTQKTMKFLMGLNDNYATVRSNVVNMEHLPTVNKVYSMALRHEKQAEMSSGKALAQPEAAAFAVKRGSRDFG